MYSTYFLPHEISNLIAPFVSFFSTILIVMTIKYKNFFKLSWILIAGAIISWGIADTIWLVQYNFMGLNPEESVLITYVYVIPNFFILAAAVNYLMSNLKKWHSFQLILDGIVIFLLIMVTLRYSIYNHMDLSQLTIHENIVNIVTMITDIISLGIVIMLVSSARQASISRTMKFIIVGYLAYLLTDFSYLYAVYVSDFYPNTLIDSMYLVAFTVWAMASYTEWIDPSLVKNPDYYIGFQNRGDNRKLLYFICIPLVMFIQGSLVLEGFIVVAIFTFFYYFMSSYIQVAIKNEGLLESEKILNERLEEIVAVRTSEVKKMYDVQAKLLVTDGLTQLSNRKHIMEKIDQMIAEGEKNFALFYLDIDDFKVANEIHGHEMGDKILIRTAHRLESLKNTNILVGRLSGDEFAVVFCKDNPIEESEIYDLCHQIKLIFEPKMVLDEYAFDVTVSMGISIYPVHATTREEIVKYANLAMYQAKKNHSKNRCMLYSRDIGDYINRKNKMDVLLKTIDYDQEFSLVYQPQFSVDGSVLIGVEALIRWNSVELGFVSPLEFIQVAEETGAILAIGRWVMRTAFKQVSDWNQQLESPLVMGINLSPLQFDSVDFYFEIERLLQEYQVESSWIDFEITENSAMNSGAAMEDVFSALSSLGVSISIDDFGTGYSSLSYIKRFDLDRLKIAKELIDHIVENHEERVIIKAIILMASGMGLKTIAEGVETREQQEILQTLGCDAIQGYYFSKPLSKHDFERQYLTALRKKA